MNDFIHDDFRLKTATSQRLYHEFTAGRLVNLQQNRTIAGKRNAA